MGTIVSILKIACVLIASMMLGNWFLAEVRKAKINEAPWYAPYVSVPGILIVLLVLFPIVLWLIQMLRLR